MRSLLICLLLASAAPAYANQCDLTSPRASVGSVPVGCPLVVYAKTATVGSYQPSIAVLRNMDYVNLAATIDRSTATLDISTTTKDALTCNETTETVATDMTLFSVTIDGIAQNDWIRLDGGDIFVGPPGPCETYLPTFYCDAPAGSCNPVDEVDEDDGNGGCSTGGAASLWLPMLALAIARSCARRRR